MTIVDAIQILASVAAVLVLINELIKHIKEWRLGSPELRLLRSQLEFQNTQVLDVVKAMSSKVRDVAGALGV